MEVLKIDTTSMFMSINIETFMLYSPRVEGLSLADQLENRRREAFLYILMQNYQIYRQHRSIEPMTWIGGV